MKKIFCDGCGKVMKDFGDNRGISYSFTSGDFCESCDSKARKLDIDYKEELSAMREKYKKMLKGK